jgi:hypothetical protein
MVHHLLCETFLEMECVVCIELDVDFHTQICGKLGCSQRTRKQESSRVLQIQVYRHPYISDQLH